MKRLTTKLFIASTILALLATTQANANDYLRLKSDARTIERKANKLAKETKHYRVTPQYEQLVCDVDQFISLSQHITDRVANGGSIGRIRTYVNQLDATFLHVEGLFDTIEYNAANGVGIKQGNTAHVKRHLNVIEDCILRMQEDVATIQARVRAENIRRPVVVNRPVVVAQRPVVVRPTPVVKQRPPTYYNAPARGSSRACPTRGRPIPAYSNPGSGRGGVTIGSGGSRINIRF